MLDPDVAKTASEYLVTQGVLGIAVMILLAALVYIWRDSKAQRKSYDDEIAAERLRHAAEIAAERKLNAELQEARLKELKTVLAAADNLTDAVQLVVDMARAKPV